MSADTTPISPSRFASAIKDLSIGMLHLKVLEIRNSIAHLQYSNDQLKPFAEGTSVALGGEPTSTSAEPDQDCIDAIKENELVIDRMAERLAIVRVEVEDRGISWTEFQSQDEVTATATAAATNTDAGVEGIEEAAINGLVNGELDASQPGETRHSAWTDGTFQTGTISNGQVRFDSQPTGQNAPSSGNAAQSTTQGGEGQDNTEEDGLHL
ncbi:uncharacterized protein TrAtP1_000741 [Trichoderma atroviride]|uniref:Uncharacterized protein n=1 Tax=Hypocrea atroviridis (strain ATCC 20476 / IMI 206040) TaxID=452589 RepID=G9NM96_HYPAI|nr:uncharacterized protein TRIATDRAFT_281752 [Trichoderma atroviride IMI 206040]EHK48028.1 hypothetical protein TRIATDRAFT_281752 [Trichoderma atroviride IMI 206040]UKZ59438.1 hypothetical protein TrAtP1_000741 [Trichoderma atroviride]